MTVPLIEVDGLSKLYRIGQSRVRELRLIADHFHEAAAETERWLRDLRDTA